MTFLRPHLIERHQTGHPDSLLLTYRILSAGKDPLIFHRIAGFWKAVGGTPTPGPIDYFCCCFVHRVVYLGEMDRIQALNSANLKPDSLTNQPRVFSPASNSS